MTKLRLLGAAAVLSTALATPALAQQVIYNPGYCAQFYPNANCQNLGPGNPYTGSYQRTAYRTSYNRWDDDRRGYRQTGFWPTDVAAGVAAVLAALLAVQPVLADHHMNTTGTETAAGNATMVEVGGGNATVQYYTFAPQVVEINAGESVTWFNQNMFTELHTVTFVMDSNLTTDIILPFSVPEGSEFEVLPPFNAGEAITMDTPNGTAIVALNKLAFYPSAIDSNGDTSYLNGTDIQYTIDSTVKAVNSGIILPPFPPGPEQNETAVGAAEIPEDQPMNATSVGETEPTSLSLLGRGVGSPPDETLPLITASATPA